MTRWMTCSGIAGDLDNHGVLISDLEMVNGGWPDVISSLKTLLETGDPSRPSSAEPSVAAQLRRGGS